MPAYEKPHTPAESRVNAPIPPRPAPVPAKKSSSVFLIVGAVIALLAILWFAFMPTVEPVTQVVEQPAQTAPVQNNDAATVPSETIVPPIPGETPAPDATPAPQSPATGTAPTTAP